jgi:hypothetical protein
MSSVFLDNDVSMFASSRGESTAGDGSLVNFASVEGTAAGERGGAVAGSDGAVRDEDGWYGKDG